jgi:integrase
MARRRPRRAYRSGTVYYRKDSGSWWINWRLPDGRKRSRGGFQREDTAKRVLAEIVHDVQLGRANIHEPERVPVLSVLAKPWLDRRETTHRSGDDDRRRWNRHLKEWFGHLRPDQIDQALLRQFIESKIGEGLSSATCLLLIRLLSTMFSDFVEDGQARGNPCKNLPKKTRRLLRPSYDPNTTPFLQTSDEVVKVFAGLPEPHNIAFALGALAGLRPGESRALKWENVHLERRQVVVCESVDGPTKSGKARIVPILDALFPVLKQWRETTGGRGLVCPPEREGNFLDEHTLGIRLDKVLKALGLPDVTWYQATRHTFASLFVMNGGSLEKLSEMLGHSTMLVTKRYAHLRPEAFSTELGRLPIDLRGAIGYTVATERI